jgi:regulator of replication initiation timing
LFGDWAYNYDNFETFSTLYNNGANYDATTTLKTIMDDIAAATQTVYFLQSNDEVYCKSLVEVAEPVLTISKNEYYTFETQKPIALQGIAHITELGENVSSGTVPIQYVRNNGFWEYHEDVSQAVETALSYIEGFELMPYNLTWRGNYALEIGDMVNIVAKDNSVVKAFILSDTITYTGGLKQTSSWSYTEPEPQTTNPSNLGEAIKQTVARVDKVKQEIELVVNETSQLKIDTKGITASVAELDAKVEAKATPEELKIEVQKGLAEEVNKVTTTTGFTFNDNGLRITKTNSEIETLITEDGMKIYKGSNEVLTADNEGVKATDLHATTYLIIGDNSRLENYSGGRTACFWIG